MRALHFLAKVLDRVGLFKGTGLGSLACTRVSRKLGARLFPKMTRLECKFSDAKLRPSRGQVVLTMSRRGVEIGLYSDIRNRSVVSPWLGWE